MHTTGVIFIGSDESLGRTVGDVVMSTAGCRFHSFASLGDATNLLRCGGVSLALVHVGDAEHCEQVDRLLWSIREFHVAVSTLAISEEYDPGLNLKLLRLGVADCLPRPLSLSRLSMLVDFLTVRARCCPPGIVCHSADASDEGHSQVAGFLFGRSGGEGLVKQLHRVAPLNTTILLAGDTGTGKTHLARVIHELSPRKNKPFLVVHCGALATTLLESELFGHVQGAFTGADSDRDGRFAAVEDGTIVLDEIDSLSAESQVKLLQVVEERTFERVGSNQSQAFRARLIVASNRDLEREVAVGKFRKDLYYRLNVVSFKMPPLRDQSGLLRLLARKFLTEFCICNKRKSMSLSGAAVAALEAYDWPGNVRELRNVIECMASLCESHKIDSDDLPDAIRYHAQEDIKLPKASPGAGVNGLDRVKQRAELDRLIATLDRHQNNRTRAAIELGISRVTLYRKLHYYGLF